ncbi:MAG: homoserine dehydrogenase [Eubacterium sp.]|nr:homoserine dehydrogenase [Eubacterium sp.]
MTKIAILGYGTIGSGVAKVIKENKNIVSGNAGDDIEVVKILDLRDFPGDENEKLVTHDYEEIVSDPEIDIVVETMGGTKPAFDFVKRALLAGKSVCTSNKALVADHGTELIQIAKDKNVKFYFEASVGGGIPILRPLRTCIVADEVESIRGILNGTTNFILTKMDRDGASYEDVLKEAQKLGYAEADPTADVEGHDTCRKIAILTALAYGAQVDFQDIDTKGISDITSEDMAYAKKLGRQIKLLGLSRRENGKLYALVSPYMLDESDALYSVSGVFNAITVKGNMLGDVMFYGQGAGKEATASAVVTDIIETVKKRGQKLDINWSADKLTVESSDKLSDRFFVRVKESDADVITAFNGAERIEGVVSGEVGFITKSLTYEEFTAKLGAKTPISVIRYA